MCFDFCSLRSAADEQLSNMIISSPTKNILSKIYEKTRLRPDMQAEREILGGDRCLLFGSNKILRLLKPDFFIVFGECHWG